MTHIETLKLALEALESIEWHGIGLCWVLDNEKVESTKAALREALAEPEQEPTLQKKDRKRGSIALARSLCYQINGAADDSDDMEPAQEQEPVEHWSDCAVHSEPAYPKGECNCGGFNLVEPKIQWKQLKPPVSSGQEHMTAEKNT